MAAALRQVVQRYEMELDIRRQFKDLIPDECLAGESSYERQRIIRLWASFIISVNELCKTRRSKIVKKSLRKAVFHSGMENLCRNFSRRQENINVQFRSDEEDHSYRLVLTILSPVPNSCRHSGRWFVAEIPLPEAEAEFVTAVSTTQIVSPIPGLAIAPITEIYPSISTENRRQSSFMNLPFAAAVQLISAPMMPTQTTPVAPSAEVEPQISTVTRQQSDKMNLPVAHEVSG